MDAERDRSCRRQRGTAPGGGPRGRRLVVHIRHEFPTADAPLFAPGSEGAQIHPKARNLQGEPVLLKHHVNSFRETDLKALLDRHGVEEVVICGAMSHMCVGAGTRAASDLGCRCVVVHDACATRDQEFEGAVVPAAQVHAAFMAALRFGYAKLVSAVAGMLGRPLRIVPVEEYVARLKAAGKSEDYARQWATTYFGVARGEFGKVDPFLGSLLGRPLRAMEEVVDRRPE
jgi:hypothetical protein